MVVLKEYVLGRSSNESFRELQTGMSIHFPGVDWTKNHRSLVMFLQKGCRYCAESAPFYQRISQGKERGKFRIIAVLPQEVDEAKQYLLELGLSADDVRKASLKAIGLRGTPTLALVDSSGEIKQLWIGKLRPEQERQVIESLASIQEPRQPD